MGNERKKVISYGGGVDSTAMLLRMDESTRIVMFDTGAENPRTLEFVRQHMLPRYPWIEIIPVLYGGLGVYDYCIKHRTAPAFALNRFCTVEYKIKPFEKILSEYDTTHVFVALNADEGKRVERHRGYENAITEFPLYTDGIGREQCKQIIQDAGLPVPPKSSCFFCPFKSRSEWRAMPQAQPDLFVKAIALENIITRKKIEKGKKLFMLADSKRPLTHIVGLDESLQACQSDNDREEIQYNFDSVPYIPYKKRV